MKVHFAREYFKQIVGLLLGAKISLKKQIAKLTRVVVALVVVHFLIAIDAVPQPYVAELLLACELVWIEDVLDGEG